MFRLTLWKILEPLETSEMRVAKVFSWLKIGIFNAALPPMNESNKLTLQVV